MIDRKIDETFLETFSNLNVEIILTNQMHYNGKVLSSGEEFIKIVDKYFKIIFIPLQNICSIEVKE